MIAAPISDVLTILAPSDLMSAVRSPFANVAANSVPHALLRSQAALHGPGRVLICGSLYLAGHVLRLHG